MGKLYRRPAIALFWYTYSMQWRPRLRNASDRPATLSSGVPRSNTISEQLRTGESGSAISPLALTVLTIALATTWSAFAWASSQRTEANTMAVNRELQETQQLLNERIQAYQDALHGFRGLFHSSASVNEKEFTDYFESIGLQKNFPGLSNLAYATNVPRAEQPAFIARIKADNSMTPQGHPDFTIVANGGYESAFVVTYRGFGQVANAGKGIDLASNQERRPVLEKARDTGVPTATSTVKLLGPDGKETNRDGFLLTIPVYGSDVPQTTEERRRQHEGFVNAVFDYDKLFADVLEKRLSKDVHIALYDDNNTFIYGQGRADEGPVRRVAGTVLVAGREWQVQLSAPKTFGVSNAESRLPLLILLSGFVVTGLLAYVFVVQSKRKQEEFDRQLRVSNERFELVAKATQDLIYDIDLTTGTMAWNDTLYDAYGYKRSTKTQTMEWWTDHIHTDDALKVSLSIDHIFSGEVRVLENEYRFQNADGSYRYVRDRAFVVRDNKGEPLRLIGSMLDVTKQKELDRAKDEFISLVSHQLRTPLTAIRLFTEMLTAGHAGKLGNKQQNYLEKIDISTKRMIQLVSDILNISRMELGHVKVEPVPTDINALILSHIDEVEPLAKAKDVTITFKPSRKLTDALIDPVMFGQFVHNLLTNAIRYSRPDNAKVTVSFKARADGYLLAVKDNGIGIPAKSQERIFERFYRAENAVKTEGEGTGLGLYLLKIISESVGGKIWFESQLGKGTTFYVQIPLAGMRARTGDKTLG